jgi:acetolactate synthase I/II/III large subunit
MTSSVAKTVYNYISKNMSTAYLFSGGSIMSLINHFHPKLNKNKMRYFVPSSESSAGFCSIGHNKSLNKCDSVVITTSGPGLTNILTPLTDAYCDNVPLLVISGDVSTTMAGKHAFQEAPAIQLTKSITYWNHTLTNEKDTATIIKKAIELVNIGKQVHINIPKDILNKNITVDEKFEIFQINKSIKNYTTESIVNVANIINKSEKPVLYVGRGSCEACNELTYLSIKGDIPVTTTLHGLGIFDESNISSLKMLGMHGSERANQAIQNSDCIICIGARFDDRTTGNIDKYAPKANNIIHINTDIKTFNQVIKNTINIHGSSKNVLLDLIPYIEFKNNSRWKKYLDLYNINFPYNENGLKQQDILMILNQELLKRPELKTNTIITTGVGNHQMFSAQLITHQYPNKFITSGSLGTMGSSNSMAIGAKIANPNNCVISIDGDQSFNMLHDLKMIMNYNIAIKIIIMNDSKQSMVNIWEKLFFNDNIVATEMNNPNYKILAEAYNIKCLNIDKTLDRNEINEIIEEFIDYDLNKPIILNCIIDSDYCLPLVPPGNALNEMITFHNINQYTPTNLDAPS